MKLAITGTRGIPNQYGGFEQFAMQLSKRLVAVGHMVIVYNPHGHSYKDNTYQGVEIIRKCLPEKLLGAGSQYLFDLFGLSDAIRRKADVILECGYASAAPWYPLLRQKGTKLITHMDGMEWQREKWSKLTRIVFRRAERKAVRYSDALVCDHPVVADHYRKVYSVNPEIIPYGAEIRESWDAVELWELGFNPGSYYLLVARLEPENNIRIIIDGFLACGIEESLIIVGDHSGSYGRVILRKFGSNNRIWFMGGIFNQKHLNNLRHFSKGLFHGHSVGGTNPSLLEAMAAGANIIAHDNPYNRYILEDNARYFISEVDVKDILQKPMDEADLRIKRERNLERIRSDYQWDTVVDKYEKLFLGLIGKSG